MILSSIPIQYQVPFFTGTLGILASTREHVTFIAVELDLVGYVAHEIESFAPNVIVTQLPGTALDMIIFEYAVEGHPRNPYNLLKSVRKKLAKALKRAEKNYEEQRIAEAVEARDKLKDHLTKVFADGN